MSSLFLDTSYNQILGFLSTEGKLSKLSIKEGQKTSASLHVELNELLRSSNSSLKEITNVIYIAGPGFYTGLRLAYGIADIMRISGARLFGFYAFDIPHLLGVENYQWITKAYRGEVFVFTRNETSTSINLLSDREFQEKDWQPSSYIHHTSALDDAMRAKLVDPIATQGLLATQMSAICSQVVASGVQKELFYFRPAEEEFKPNP